MAINNSDILFERPTNVDQPSNFFLDYINKITDGAWSFAIPMMVFAVVYLSLNDYSPTKAYSAASFASLITVVMLVGLGLLGSQALIIAVILVVLGVVLNNNGGRV